MNRLEIKTIINLNPYQHGMKYEWCTEWGRRKHSSAYTHTKLHSEYQDPIFHPLPLLFTNKPCQ